MNAAKLVALRYGSKYDSLYDKMRNLAMTHGYCSEECTCSELVSWSKDNNIYHCGAFGAFAEAWAGEPIEGRANADRVAKVLGVPAAEVYSQMANLAIADAACNSSTACTPAEVYKWTHSGSFMDSSKTTPELKAYALAFGGKAVDFESIAVEVATALGE
jgi:hypothetical protein